MDIMLKRAILHMYDKDSGVPVFSTVTLDFAKEYIYNYVTKKVSKMSSAQTKTGTLVEDSKFATLVNEIDQDNFTEKSKDLFEHWMHYYSQGEDVPSSDVLIVLYEHETSRHIAFMKLALKDSMSHVVVQEEGEVAANFQLNRAILPAASSKPDEGIDINLDNLGFELLEKRYTFSGEKHWYMSEYVIEAQPAPSLEQSVREVKKLAKSIAKKYDDDEYDVLASVQEAVYESIEEYGTINNDMVAEHVFSDNVSAKLEYKDEIAVKLPEVTTPVQTSREISEKKFGKQKLKLSNDIELIVPMDVYRDSNLIEFVNNPDGTISIMIKNIEEIVNKL